MNAQSLRGPLGWSVVSIIAILAFVVYAVSTIGSPIFQQSAADTTTSKNTDSLVEKYNSYVAVDIARFNGRSAFFKPIRIAPPTKPAPPVVVKEEEEEEEVIYVPPVQTAPPTYMGPPLIAIIGEEAWFRGSGSGAKAVIRLLVGEEQDGLKLVGTTLPSMVTIEHRTGIYEIDLFSAEEPFFRLNPLPIVSDSFLEEVEG